MRPTKGEEKLAVRLSERELKAIDAHVHAGGFRTRSELVRAAIEQYLAFNLETLTRRTESPEEIRVRLREHEIDLISRYVELVAGGNLADALAMLVRRGVDVTQVLEAVRGAETRLQEAGSRNSRVVLNRSRLEAADEEPARTVRGRQT